MTKNQPNHKIPDSGQTIFALATGSIPSAIAIIRISGPACSLIITNLTKREKLPPARLARRQLLYKNKAEHTPQKQDIIDEALVLWFPSPNSFTGEDMAELHVHGSRAVIEMLYQELLRFPNTRIAEPGEFARRAFYNSKLDLTSIEGLADLLAAETQAQQQQAIRQYQGELGQLYDGWRQKLIRLSAYLEAYIDFPDEELPSTLTDQLKQQLKDFELQLTNHLADAGRGQKLRQGVQLTIVGPPNAGKSSLMNWLTRRETSIVSAIPGTTRDVIEAILNIGGIPVILSDTAGLRPTTDAIEQEGVRRAQERAGQSDLNIFMLDVTHWPIILSDMAPMIKPETIVLVNKIDLMPPNVMNNYRTERTFFVSLKTNQGLQDFFKFLEHEVQKLAGLTEKPVLTRLRHRAALERCLQNIQHAQQNMVIELKAEDLRLAVRALGEITGRVHIDEMLDVIFREFCIGK